MVTQRIEDESGRTLNERIDRARLALEEALKSLASPLPKSGSEESAGTFAGVRSVLDAVESGGKQREILQALLAATMLTCRRAAIFIVKGETLVGWAGVGFRSEAPGGGLPPHVTLPARGDHLLARALALKSRATAGPAGPGFVVTQALGGLAPSGAMALPLLVRGRVVGILYGDMAEASDLLPDSALDIVGRVGSLALASLPVASRKARRAISVEATATQEPDDAEPEALSSGITPPEDAEMHALLSDLDGVQRLEGGDSGMAPEDQRQHADARRFASLLVSELLLYNEESVILGRKNRDLARRLGKEIERSRQAFAARVPKHLRGFGRYLDEELIRVLAEGDSSLLRD
jgi:hypothetical protein